MQYRVLLFQPYLRKHILNFAHGLKQFDFVYQKKSGYSYANLPSFKEEIQRRKDRSPVVRLRRLLGVPNIRIKLTRDADLLFTYGCLLITNKPYATYVETGVALYNYDVQIAKNPIARFLVAWLATRSNCKKLIFLSEAGRRSFFATVHYSQKVERILRAKSTVIYPFIESEPTAPKRSSPKLKLLFVGLFYMKGGMESAHAYEALRQKYKNVTLTVITPTHMLRTKDKGYLESLPGLHLLDAKFSAAEMNAMYREHDIFVLPTYREGFGLVVIEALSFAMPVIVTDQYAVAEMAIDGKNGFVYPNHLLKDYNPKTYEMLGRYHNPKDFYADLFRFQKEGQLQPVEEFLISSIEQYLNKPALLTTHSKGSIALFNKKFHPKVIGRQIEQVFLSAINTR